MRLFLAEVEALGPEDREAIRGALPEGDLRRIEEVASVGWLPVEINLRATEIVWRRLGPGARTEFFHRLGEHDFNSTLLKSFIAGAIGMFGVDPSRLVRMFPRGWAQVFRDDTRITVDTSLARQARITFAGLPSALARSPAWKASVAASLFALYGVTRRRGTVTVEGPEDDSATMTLVFRWE